MNGAAIRASLLYSRVVAILVVCSLLIACDDIRFPRDPEKTLETVLADREMTVAFADNPPWVTFHGEGPPQGIEVDLVRAFADELEVAIDWKRLGAFSALEGLERGNIDLAIGGFDRKDVTPVAGAAPSFVYFEEFFDVGARPATAGSDDLEGRKVYVPQDLPLTKIVENRGGIPVEAWSDAVDYAAGPRWLLETKGLLPTNIELHRAEHVMAVRQGESAWLMRLERFLRRETEDIGARLREIVR
ncbi:transporter substrate-binding domain-containing protein [Sulfitobacter delicatus]|uniref:transporter substrate-binding domain-containing protein n=1 Tax=Sulfitobacter delicatus TaxID=218672 RepID=UPI00111442EA|nr:transporter substrate-binding domain-containing protein [Sulfitobacter delicatus]